MADMAYTCEDMLDICFGNFIYLDSLLDMYSSQIILQFGRIFFNCLEIRIDGLLLTAVMAASLFWFVTCEEMLSIYAVGVGYARFNIYTFGHIGAEKSSTSSILRLVSYIFRWEGSGVDVFPVSYAIQREP